MADHDLCHDVYIDQLEEVFQSCDVQNKGFLEVWELNTLCDKLQLEDNKQLLFDKLISQDEKVYFQEFKGLFLGLLQENIGKKKEGDDSANVSPKFVLGEKKYGRRTRPESESLESDILEKSILDLSNVRCSTNSFLLKPHQTSLSAESYKHEDGSVHHDADNCSDQSIRWDRDVADETFESEGPLDVSVSELGMDRLQEMWTELGVGQDGFLTIDELRLVCLHYGMKSMTDTDIQDVFKKLDIDNDGKVSFNEFIRGFLHHASDHEEQHLSPISRLPQSITKGRRVDERNTSTYVIGDGGAAGLFSTIDTENTGYATPSDVIDLWERVGINQGVNILTTLGFELDVRVNLGELSFSLERELLANNNQDVLYQAALATYQQEIKHLRINLDNISGERDKLKLDLSEANARNTLMAKEADERHVHLEKSAEVKLLIIEKKYTDEVKSLQNTLDDERFNHNSISTRYQTQLQDYRESRRQEETSLKKQLYQAQMEIERLESDMTESVRRLGEAEKMIVRLQTELETTGELRQKLAEYERSTYLGEESKKFSKEKMQQMETENKGLKDKNDELTAEVEGMRQKVVVSRRSKRHSTGSRIPIRGGSLLSDYVKPGRRKYRSVAGLPSLSSTETEIEEDENETFIQKQNRTVPDLPSPDGYESGSGNELAKVAHLQKELRQNNAYLERETKEIEHAYRLEISQLEERHLMEKEQLLRNIEETKVKENELFNRAKEEMSAEMQRELQTSFALEKQDLFQKHESEKNLLECKAGEDRRKQAERLKEEFDRDLTQKLIELKNEFNTDRTKLEDINKNHKLTIQSLKRTLTEMDLKMKLQEEELSLQFDQKRQDLLERNRLELKHVEMSHKHQILEYEHMFSGGVDSLKGKLQEDFYFLLSQQKEEELMIDRSAMLEHIQQRNDQQMSFVEDEKSKLYNEFENEKAKIIERFEEQIEVLKFDMENLQSQLDVEREDMKDRHIVEKETLEANLYKVIREEIEEEFSQKVDKLKNNFDGERDSWECCNRINEEEIMFLKTQIEQKEKLFTNIEELNTSVSLLQLDNQKITLEKQKLQNEVVNHESELNETKTSLKQQLQDITAIKVNLESKLSDMTTIKIELEKKIIDLSSAKGRLENRIDELLEDKNLTITAMTYKQLEVLNQSEVKEKALQESFIEEKSILEIQIVTLKGKVEILQEKIGDIVNLESVIEELEEERDDYRHKLTKLSDNNKHIQTELNRLKQNEEESEEQIQLLKNELQSKADEDVQLKTELKRWKQNEEESEKQIQLLKNKLQSKADENVQFKSELNRLKQNEENLEEKIQFLKNELENIQLKDSENKENQILQNNSSCSLHLPSPDESKIKMLQEELSQMKLRKDEYKRLSDNLKKQLQDFEKIKIKHDKEQISNLQKEKRKLEDILKKTTDQLFQASNDLAKSQYKYANEIQSWKEKTSSMVDLENYTKVQLNFLEQQRLVLLLQEALRNQNEATEKLHKELVQEHSKKMGQAEEDNHRILQKLEQCKASFNEISEKYRDMLSKNKALYVDNSKLAQTLRDTVKRELNLEKRCMQLQESCTTLKSVLHKTYNKVLT